MYYIVACGARAGFILRDGPVRAGEVLLLCDGGAFDPAEYAALADKLYLYPKGTLPDLRGL